MTKIENILEEIHSALKAAYPGEGSVYNWIDDNFDESHKSAIDRFESVLVKARGSADYFKHMEIEAKIYRDTILHFYSEYVKAIGPTGLRRDTETLGLFDFLAREQKKTPKGGAL